MNAANGMTCAINILLKDSSVTAFNIEPKFTASEIRDPKSSAVTAWTQNIKDVFR